MILYFFRILFLIIFIIAASVSDVDAQVSEKEEIIESLTQMHAKQFHGVSTMNEFSQIFNANPDDIGVKYLAYISALELMISSPTIDNFKAFNFAFPEQPSDLADEVKEFDDLLASDGFNIYEGSGTWADSDYVIQGPGRSRLSSDALVTGVFEAIPYIAYHETDGTPVYLDQDTDSLHMSEVTGEAFISFLNGDEMYAYCICKRIRDGEKWGGFEGVMWEDQSQYIGLFDEGGVPHGNGKIIHQDGTSETVVMKHGEIK